MGLHVGAQARVGGAGAQQQLDGADDAAPNTLLIPGTRSVGHLEENVGAADVTLDADALERLDAVGTTEPQPHRVEPFQR
ncbi:hypothetical protein MMAN_33100 [Mycobacterium mantenii]|uniref:NADP-dependent oxidoreductase domain-containing protein n=1 Tax=Mycobacterium mantenii TaxID=560555 RepID=A0A1X0G3B6_MYCNT|nr:hypothetical protein BST30_03235 [Mycobacterium mantenii]BBY39176.1 hypothetical protein MMAN_33100 [Mycobacterium mantenii]